MPPVRSRDEGATPVSADGGQQLSLGVTPEVAPEAPPAGSAEPPRCSWPSRVADVAVPVPLAQAFTYAIPDELHDDVVVGARVLVEFGRRRVLGIVLSLREQEPDDGKTRRLKPIRALVDRAPVVSEELLTFLSALSAYYFAPIGEVLRLALPAVEREQMKQLERDGALEAGADLNIKTVGPRLIAFARATEKREAPGSLRGQTAAALSRIRAVGSISVAKLTADFGNARRAVKKLEDLGLITVEQRPVEADPFFAEEVKRDAPPQLNDAQQRAVERIEQALAGSKLDDSGVEPVNAGPGAQRAFLLFGVTGSGKTEVYLRAIAACRAAGRGALVMVPEIALTPQVVARFRARFGDDVAVLHSGLKERERHAMWQRLRQGEVHVAIGARSALFAPVPDLGLIVVDEEHDGSFKQEEGVRYQARDMALLRAHRTGAVALLGSATPSLESVALIERGKMEQLDLPDRAAGSATMPTVEIVDLRTIGNASPTSTKLITYPLYRALEETLAAGEQAIFFLNRRGFAPSVVCNSCGHVETCPACAVGLTYHRTRRTAGIVRCHYCGYETDLPSRCSSCRAPDVHSLEGLGTEQLEAALSEAFPKARVARLDRDVAAGAKSQAILDRMRDGEIDVLVGTQMVTKGHDLPRVTLVGVINADSALSMPDFRAGERGFSLLVQVAGRAGRHDRPGRVIVQTRNPDHTAIRCARKHDVRSFWQGELADRKEAGYPPFARIALLRIDGLNETATEEQAMSLAAELRTTAPVLQHQVELLGPAPAPIPRLRGRYRFRIMLRSEQRAPLRAVLRVALASRKNADRRVRMAIDVDPVSML